MPTYGTLQTLDTLNSTFQTVAQFGEDTAYAQIEALLEAHNKIVGSMNEDLVDPTTDNQRRYGTTDAMTMTKTDEFGRPDAQKVSPGAVAGFPLESFQVGIQWTRKYFQTASVSEMMGQVIAAMDADVTRVINEIKRALYNPTNYTFNDYLVNRLSQIPLQVRALLNADGLGIPAGPNGETFNGSTHNHFLVCATPGTPIAADVVAGLETVLEHYATGEAVIAINRAQETAIRGMTSNFVPMLNANIVGATTANQYPGTGKLEGVALYNRQIGEFNGAEVWVKPWAISGYIVTYIRNQPKALVMRTRGVGTGGLQLVADDEKYPLRSRCWEREFGVGIWNRTAASIIDCANGTYTAPSIPF